MSKNYVKKHKGHDVPDGAAHYNDKNRCFYNKDKTRYYNTECVGNGWTDLNFKTYAENSTELPEQDLPNWDDAPEWADRALSHGEGEPWKFSDGEFFDCGNAIFGKVKHGGPSVGAAEWASVGDFALCEMRPIDKTNTPNWDDQPKEGDVWIEDRKDPSGDGWYYVTKDLPGLYVKYETGDAYYTDYSHLTIHKRPIAIEDKEWLPTVGEECQCLLIDDELDESVFVDVKLLYQFDNGEYAVMRLDTCALEYSSEFRPLKTAEEVMREMFIEACYLKSRAVENVTTKGIFDDLFDAGFTAPKGDK